MQFIEWYERTVQEAKATPYHPREISAHIFWNKLGGNESNVQTQTAETIKRNVEEASKLFKEFSRSNKFHYELSHQTFRFLERAQQINTTESIEKEEKVEGEVEEVESPNLEIEKNAFEKDQADAPEVVPNPSQESSSMELSFDQKLYSLYQKVGENISKFRSLAEQEGYPESKISAFIEDITDGEYSAKESSEGNDALYVEKKEGASTKNKNLEISLRTTYKGHQIVLGTGDNIDRPYLNIDGQDVEPSEYMVEPYMEEQTALIGIKHTLDMEARFSKVTEGSSIEIASGSLDDWYNRVGSEQRKYADQTAMEMFRKKFLDLDDEDQRHVVDGYGRSKFYFGQVEKNDVGGPGAPIGDTPPSDPNKLQEDPNKLRPQEGPTNTNDNIKERQPMPKNPMYGE